jgi:hypothetical protein
VAKMYHGCGSYSFTVFVFEDLSNNFIPNKCFQNNKVVKINVYYMKIKHCTVYYIFYVGTCTSPAISTLSIILKKNINDEEIS